MRLIDADKLYPDCMTKNGTLAISQSQIANAPTVDTTFKEAVAYECGQKSVERPQDEWGKWIEETDEHLKGMYRCSICGRRVDGSVLDDLLMIDEDYTISDCYPFCHCGAEMRKEAEE